MSDPTRTVNIDPEHAARVVGDFADSVNLPVPTTAGEVVAFLERCDYLVTARTLSEFAEKHYVSDPGDQWDAVAVYCLMAALESRRRWKPAPSRHDHKKTGISLQIEAARAAGVAEPINDLDRYTVEDLLLQLTQCDHRATRECLYEALREKLRGYEE